jgi:hypothetical protein
MHRHLLGIYISFSELLCTLRWNERRSKTETPSQDLPQKVRDHPPSTAPTLYALIRSKTYLHILDRFVVRLSLSHTACLSILHNRGDRPELCEACPHRVYYHAGSVLIKHLQKNLRAAVSATTLFFPQARGSRFQNEIYKPEHICCTFESAKSENHHCSHFFPNLSGEGLFLSGNVEISIFYEKLSMET